MAKMKPVLEDEKTLKIVVPPTTKANNIECHWLIVRLLCHKRKQLIEQERNAYHAFSVRIKDFSKRL